MILGRTPEGLIKIKKDAPLGLRAVNCACCGGKCPYYGIYYSSEFDSSYSFNDLPASLQLTGVATPFNDVVNVFKNSIQISVSGLINLLYVRPVFFNEYEPGFYEGGWGIGLYAEGWKNVFYTQDFEGNWFEDTASEYSSFLISNFEGQYRTLDFFADTYSILKSGASVTVTRPTELDPYYEDIIVPAKNRICNPGTDPYEYANPGLWENTTGFKLYFGAVYDVFDYSIIVDSSSKWTIKSETGVFRKIGNQDSPIGSYAGGYTVS